MSSEQFQGKQIPTRLRAMPHLFALQALEKKFVALLQNMIPYIHKTFQCNNVSVFFCNGNLVGVSFNLDAILEMWLGQYFQPIKCFYLKLAIGSHSLI
jgi:hypothetical protein